MEEVVAWPVTLVLHKSQGGKGKGKYGYYRDEVRLASAAELCQTLVTEVIENGHTFDSVRDGKGRPMDIVWRAAAVRAAQVAVSCCAEERAELAPAEEAAAKA